MKLIIDTALLCMAFPFLAAGTGMSHFGETITEYTIAADHPLLPATTSGWTDLYSGMIADDAKHSFDCDLASYSGDLIFSSTLFGRNSVGFEGSSMNRDKPYNITGVVAVALLIGALRLYFTSVGFRKLLFETFSPLSPLGY
jgi:hypothetical protein